MKSNVIRWEGLEVGWGGEVDFSSLNMPKPVIKSEILMLGHLSLSIMPLAECGGMATPRS